jgi:hypothetical protein
MQPPLDGVDTVNLIEVGARSIEGNHAARCEIELAGHLYFDCSLVPH